MPVAYDNSASGGGGGVSSVSFALTVSGSNRLLHVGISRYRAGVSTTSVTYNSVGATEIPGSGINDGVYYVQQYSLTAPDTGSNTVQATFSDSPFDFGVVAISFTGVDQSTPLGAPGTASGTSITPSVTAAGATADDFVVDQLLIIHSGTLSVGAEQTARANTTANGFIKYGASTQDGADGGTMSWNNSTSQSWLISAVAVKATASTVLPHHLMLLGVGR